MPLLGSTSVALVVTGDFSQSALAQDPSTALSRIAAVGQMRRIPDTRARSIPALHDWQLAILDAIGLSGQSDRFPSAAIARQGASSSRDSSACWAHLSCVHLAAGMSDVSGALLDGDIALSEGDSSEIAATLGAHLRSDGYELYAAQGSEWYVRCPRDLRAETMPPEAAFRTSLKEALPSGADAAELRRLMTELQMLLHDHPVNARRGRAGLPAANAAWLWSVANAAPVSPGVQLPLAFGSVAYLKGLYSLHSQTVRSEDSDVQSIVDAARESGSSVAVIAPASFESLERQWMGPLIWLLKTGMFAKLLVYFAGWRVEARRSDLVRFWRRGHPPSRWSA